MTAIAALLFGWIAVRIWDAYDQLDTYGVDRPAVAGLAVGVCAASALAYGVAAVMLRRRAPWSRTLITAVAVPGVAGALYIVVLGATHLDFVGFAAAPMILFGTLGLWLTLHLARAVRRPEVKAWFAHR